MEWFLLLELIPAQALENVRLLGIVHSIYLRSRSDLPNSSGISFILLIRFGVQYTHRGRECVQETDKSPASRRRLCRWWGFHRRRVRVGPSALGVPPSQREHKGKMIKYEQSEFSTEGRAYRPRSIWHHHMGSQPPPRDSFAH